MRTAKVEVTYLGPRGSGDGAWATPRNREPATGFIDAQIGNDSRRVPFVEARGELGSITVTATPRDQIRRS